MTEPLHPWPLTDFVDGRLDRADHEQIAAHLRDCEACRADAELVRLGRLALGHAQRAGDEPTSGELDRLHDRLVSGLDPAVADAPAVARAVAAPAAAPATAPAAVGQAPATLAVPGPGRQRPAGGPSRRTVLGLAASAAAAACLAGVVITRGVRPGPGRASVPSPQDNSPSSADDPVLAAALSGFEAGRLPGSATVPGDPPDLSDLGLTVQASGAGVLAAQEVAAYDYRAATPSTRVTVYRSERTFDSPALAGARYIPVPMDEAWVTWIPGTPSVLVIGTDEKLVHDVCEALL